MVARRHAADPTVEALPELSVIIPLHGGETFVGETLDALFANTDAAFEVIVVDNASPDRALSIAAERNVQLVTNEENLGFGVACNQGAAIARAPLLCFLNSDARVEPGWFDAVDAALRADEDAAAAVPLYLEPNGSVQEAGAVIDGSGEGVLLGHDTDVGDPIVSFGRYVEYGSAACVVIRRRDFEQVGGMDPAFGLAYYEDADLGLRLAQLGRRVRFVPDATVTHTRGASTAGVALASLKARNRELIIRRYGELLADRPVLEDLEAHPERLFALRDARCAQRSFLCVEQVPRANSPLGLVIMALARRWPQHRTTLVAARRVVDGTRWEHAGVELAAGHDDWYGWMRSRVGQATVTWTLGADAHARFDRLLRVTQRQAARVHWCDPLPAMPDNQESSASSPSHLFGDPPAASEKAEVNLEAAATADLSIGAVDAKKLLANPAALAPLLTTLGWPRPTSSFA